MATIALVAPFIPVEIEVLAYKACNDTTKIEHNWEHIYKGFLRDLLKNVDKIPTLREENVMNFATFINIANAHSQLR